MNKTPDADLDAEVKRLLEARKGDWQDVVRIGDVSHSWLSKFVNGHIGNPGYATLKRLHRILSAEPKRRAGDHAAASDTASP